MRYAGSKNKVAKELLPTILHHRKENQWWVEPFAGTYNVTTKVRGRRIANEINKYIVALFKSILSGWEPPDEITEEQYKQIQQDRDGYPDHLVGFVGFGCSFGGKWFAGYARGSDYCGKAKRACEKKCKRLKGVQLECGDYRDLVIPEESLIYCDPPYQSTISYDAVGEFDHVVFWDWIREKSDEGHTVFVSEYSAPKDFVCVWDKRVKVTVSLDVYEAVEKLFVCKYAVQETDF